ncbi:hypothetical protein [Parapedobacter lycopersici]|uniref:hypothetical protein n=1 Tax=Parapedobacter lycopersici TaxID=1864939 RepID=UPI00333EFCAD
MNSVYMRPSPDGKTMITIFRTDVAERQQAQFIINELQQRFPGARFSFDLWDCDRVFRMEATDDIVGAVVRFFNDEGLLCEIL